MLHFKEIQIVVCFTAVMALSSVIHSFETTAEKENVFNRFTSNAGDVSLFSGSAVQKYQLAEIVEGDLKVPVTMSYSSNVNRTVRADNSINPTGWVGLGWNLSFGSIICNHNNTASIDDDIYYWVTPKGNRLEIIRHGENEYSIEKKPYTKISPMLKDGIIVGWTLTEPDGTKFLFGDFEDETKQATRYTFRWDWYVGETRLRQKPEINPEQYPYQWDLSEIVSTTGNSVAFNYEQKQEGLKVEIYEGFKDPKFYPPVPSTEWYWNSEDEGIYYTKSSWLKSIESKTGGKIIFETKSKNPEEYIDPYTFYPEPDNFIEFYDTILLNKITLYSPDNIVLKSIVLDYEKINGSLEGNLSTPV